ncbi:tRNA (cytidine(34)-2'-O)-methyltransferase [Rhynchospora pubera]|uniref:tRNA (Cytidine(34)-2'-O)-methyltransferase n=1 Tax=Rhynchospora pubera TaxID=906938 RepID=A0AAV8G911_9POAL|nr:tRNA (cytidine(34)-2'-O)-methyltransferase [Rhynchospora pubera]
MEQSGFRVRVRALNFTHPPVNFIRRSSGIVSWSRKPFLAKPFKCNSSPLSTSCSVEKDDSNDLSDGALSLVGEDSSKKILQVVLVSPQIPGNTGSIARTCAASAVGLHLVGPLGYKIEDSKLKRAGLDYWPYVVVKIHESWDEFRNYFREQVFRMQDMISYYLSLSLCLSISLLFYIYLFKAGEKRLLAFSKRGSCVHSDFSYRRGDWLVFGSETKGLPPEALQDCSGEELGGGTLLRIPMVDTYVRCLNLSVSVGVALYEAARQLNYQQLQTPAAPETQRLFLREDIYG